MKDLIPFAIVALVCLGAGALLHKQCSSPEKVTVTQTQTVTKWDTIQTTSPSRIIYRDRVKTEIVYEEITDPLARNAIDSLAMELWFCQEVEISAGKTLQHGRLDVGFSMPRFLTDPQTALDIHYQANPDTARIEYVTRERQWWQRFGYGPQVGIGMSGLGPSWYGGIGIHYDMSGMFGK